MRTRMFSLILTAFVSTNAHAKNWGLNEKGLNVYKAWTIEKGSPDIVVGVVDTGVDFSHPDLKGKEWVNEGETGPWTPANEAQAKLAPNCFDKSCNKIDDDKDGYVDNINGFDFALNKNSARDAHGHGTHIAGIIAGSINVDAGVGGVAPKIKIASYRYYGTDSSGQLPDLEKAVDSNGANKAMEWSVKALGLAVKNNVQIINYSGGGTSPIEEERQILLEAERKGILVVVAAGNERDNLNLPHKTYYPCSYKLSNIICVGNLTEDDKVAVTSNKGKKQVDVFAPGSQILSTGLGQGYTYLTGTSQATAFISGLAALIYSHDKTLNYMEVKDIILRSTSTPLKSLKEQSLADGKIDAYLALQKTEELIMIKNKVNEMQKNEFYVFETLNKTSVKYSRGVSAINSSSSENGH